MIKIESGIVIPQKPLLYHHYIDGIHNSRKKSKHDELFEKLNNYHSKIKLTIKVSPTKFLNASLNLYNGIYKFIVYSKTKKQSTSPTKFFGYKFES